VQTISAGSFPTLPILSMNASGQASLMYNQLDQGFGQYRFFVRQYNASLDTWSNATPVLNTGPNPTALGCECAQFEVSNNGNAMAIWEDNASLKARAYDLATDTWKPEQVLVGTGAKIGLDASGNASLIYHQLANPQPLFSQRYMANTDTWAAKDTIATGSGFGREAAFNPTGDAIALFWQDANYMLASRAATASAWSNPLADGTTETRRVALDDAGRAIILRIGYNATLGQYEIQTKRIGIR
jgi:hypothetical protein